MAALRTKTKGRGGGAYKGVLCMEAVEKTHECVTASHLLWSHENNSDSRRMLFQR